MTATLAPPVETVAGLVRRLGSVPPDRILPHPGPGTATARVYSAPETFRLVTEKGSPEGADLLPGFTLLLKEWFSRAEGGPGPQA